VSATPHDLAVVGAGIVGLAVARAWRLAGGGERIVVLEREQRVAAHQTGHNSGVLHAGISYRPGSLKADLCVRGARAMRDFCAEHRVDLRESGKLILATHERQRPALEELYRRGVANGVPGLELLPAERIAEHEPHARGVAALWSPATAVVDFGVVAVALARELEARGGELRLSCAVRRLRESAAGVELDCDGGVVRARRAIVCAGAWADDLAPPSADPDLRIVPFRGAYRTLRAERAQLVHSLIYPVPDPALPFLGVHLTRGLDGTVRVGPSALLVGARDAYRLARTTPRELARIAGWAGTWRLLRRWPGGAARELLLAASDRAFARAAARLVPGIAAGDLRPGPVGVRAQAVDRRGTLVDDFAISRTARTVHVRNAPSPAATSALALAELIVARAMRD
jgi:(S)-2-hydroxyglutarate dehydrogenase